MGWPAAGPAPRASPARALYVWRSWGAVPRARAKGLEKGTAVIHGMYTLYDHTRTHSPPGVPYKNPLGKRPLSAVVASCSACSDKIFEHQIDALDEGMRRNVQRPFLFSSEFSTKSSRNISPHSFIQGINLAFEDFCRCQEPLELSELSVPMSRAGRVPCHPLLPHLSTLCQLCQLSQLSTRSHVSATL